MTYRLIETEIMYGYKLFIKADWNEVKFSAEARDARKEFERIFIRNTDNAPSDFWGICFYANFNQMTKKETKELKKLSKEKHVGNINSFGTNYKVTCSCGFEGEYHPYPYKAIEELDWHYAQIGTSYSL